MTRLSSVTSRHRLPIHVRVAREATLRRLRFTPTLQCRICPPTKQRLGLPESMRAATWSDSKLTSLTMKESLASRILISRLLQQGLPRLGMSRDMFYQAQVRLRPFVSRLTRMISNLSQGRERSSN